MSRGEKLLEMIVRVTGRIVESLIGQLRSG